jgi:ATP-binding cassette subfamily B protein
MTATDTASGLYLRSAIPGRERWIADALRSNRSAAHALEEKLREQQGIHIIEVNPLTGSVLVYFDHKAGLQVESLIRAALQLLSTSVGKRPLNQPTSQGANPTAQGATAPTKKAETRKGRQLRTAGLVAGTLIVPRLLFGGTLLTPGGLVGAAVLGGSLVAGFSWRRWTQRVTGTNKAAPPGKAPATPYPLQRLLVYLRPYKRQVLKASFFSVLKKLTDLAPPVIAGMAVDVIVNRRVFLLTALGITSVPAQILILGSMTVVSFCLESYFEYSHKSSWLQLSQQVQHDLRLKAYDHVQRLQLSFIESESSGKIAAILNDNVHQLEQFLGETVHSFIEITTNMVVVGTIFLVIAPSIAWVGMLPIPVILWLTMDYHDEIKPIHVRIRERGGRVAGQFVNNIGGITTIRSFGTEETERQRIQHLGQDYLEANIPANQLFAAFAPTVRIPILSGLTGLLILGGLAAAGGQLTPGGYSTILFLTQRFLFPFATLGNVIDRYQRTMTAVSRVFSLLDEPAGLTGGTTPLPVEQVRGQISFENVSFGYLEHMPILKGFSLHAAAGETVAIVGPTGAGKTTILKLLLRFYEFQSGRILIDGLDIRQVQLRDLRNAIGVVPQDTFLFDATVWDNVTYGAYGASPEEVAEALRLAEAHGFVQALPNGLNTVVGERGVKLSTGQRQRLSIARALLKNPPILILDEATSSVDNETEAAIQRSLARISVGRTTIVIAHRLSTIRHANCIYVLGEQGRIVEKGKHEELLEHAGPYALLWKVQMGEQSF